MKDSPSRWCRVVARMVGVAAAILMAGAQASAQAGANGAAPAQPPAAAPLFTLAGLQGESISLAELRGRFVVIHFAASWWPFCNAEAPHLEALWQNYRARGVEVLIINVKEEVDKARGWAERWKFTFPVLLDRDGKVSASYAPADVLPDLAREDVSIASNLLIDREGRIQFFSPLDTNRFDAKLVALRARLDELLGAADGPR